MVEGLGFTEEHKLDEQASSFPGAKPGPDFSDYNSPALSGI